MPIYKTTHLCIPRELLVMEDDGAPLYDRITTSLTFINEAIQMKNDLGYGAYEDPNILGYEDDDDYLYVPRGYKLPDDLSGEEVIDHVPAYEADLSWPEVVVPLREDQYAAAQSLLDTPGDKLLELGCGKGKTNIALWYAAQLQRKTLIIVDRYDLADQWIDRICGTDTKEGVFHGYDPKAIGQLYKGKMTVGEHLTVACIQTLATKQDVLGEEFWAQFGLIIADEAHVLGGGGSFGSVIARFQGERLALTATPTRKDGLHELFRLHFGGMRSCHRDLARDNPATWVFKSLPPLVHPNVMETFYKRVPGGNLRMRGNSQEVQRVLQLPKYVTAACRNEGWNSEIIRDIGNAVEKGRNILVLGERVEHMHMLADYCVNDLWISAAAVTRVESKSARTEGKQKQVIFATWQLAGKGLDIERLDTLIITCPYNDEGRLRQEKGRIDRMFEGKKPPVVVVYCHDAVPSMVRKKQAMMQQLANIDGERAVIKQVRASF